MNDRSISLINNILKNQLNFNWQEIHPYKKYKNSFEYHVYHHPINERNTGIWDKLIKYDNIETISDSYYKISTDLAKKYKSISTNDYDIQYIKDHDSYNIVDKNNGLIVCLKYNLYKMRFDIATCFFPKKINCLFSIKDIIDNKYDTDKMYFMLPINNKDYDINNPYIFKEAMEEYFGSDSIEYKILFKNKLNDISNTINSIKDDIGEYLSLMESLIKNDNDKKYYFVYNDGIEYIVKLSILYKIKDSDYEIFYQRFINIDINDTYKKALEECKEYIEKKV